MLDLTNLPHEITKIALIASSFFLFPLIAQAETDVGMQAFPTTEFIDQQNNPASLPSEFDLSKLRASIPAADKSTPEPAEGGWRFTATETQQSQNLPPATSIPAYGPQQGSAPTSPAVSDNPNRYTSFGAKMGAIKWELGALLGYLTIIDARKVILHPQGFRFQDEGWFGRNTNNLGVDKLTHAFNSYLLAELLQARIKKKTDGAPGSALAGAALASGFMIYNEIYDGLEKSSGFNWQDVVFNTAGATFSLLRNNVPGLDQKLDFRMMIVPNSDLYTFQGKRHFEQQRFLLALKLAGFNRFQYGPLRYVELHAGYYGAHFDLQDRANGIKPDRRPFIGIGLNVGELLFGKPRGKWGRAGKEVFNYLQLPYTAAHIY